MGSGKDSGMRLGLGSILRGIRCSEQKDQQGRDGVSRASVLLKPQVFVEHCGPGEVETGRARSKNGPRVFWKEPPDTGHHVILNPSAPKSLQINLK